MFITPLILRALDQPDLWAFEVPLIWRGPGFTATCPKGAITDLASEPRIIRGWKEYDVNGSPRRPSALHDMGYAFGRERGKPFIDSLFYEALRVEGVGALTAGIMYQAVHLFGARAWASDGDYYVTGADFVTREDWLAFKAKGCTIFSVP